MAETMHHYLIFETASGFCGIAWSDAGITRFQLPTKSAEATERLLLRRLPDAESGAPTPAVLETVAAVKRYFQGEETDFSGVELDLAGQDAFFRDIYAAARRVGWGRTTTYGALAKELGVGPEAARDVGQAMAKNPVALIIPCHRVPRLRQDRRLLRSRRFVIESPHAGTRRRQPCAATACPAVAEFLEQFRKTALDFCWNCFGKTSADQCGLAVGRMMISLTSTSSGWLTA